MAKAQVPADAVDLARSQHGVTAPAKIAGVGMVHEMAGMAADDVRMGALNLGGGRQSRSAGMIPSKILVRSGLSLFERAPDGLLVERAVRRGHRDHEPDQAHRARYPG